MSLSLESTISLDALVFIYRIICARLGVLPAPKQSFLLMRLVIAISRLAHAWSKLRISVRVVVSINWRAARGMGARHEFQTGQPRFRLLDQLPLQPPSKVKDEIHTAVGS